MYRTDKQKEDRVMGSLAYTQFPLRTMYLVTMWTGTRVTPSSPS